MNNAIRVIIPYSEREGLRNILLGAGLRGSGKLYEGQYAAAILETHRAGESAEPPLDGLVMDEPVAELTLAPTDSSNPQYAELVRRIDVYMGKVFAR